LVAFAAEKGLDMQTYSLGLALFDFVPTFFFLIGAFFLVKTVLICVGKPAARMLMAGSALVFIGGFLKAVWKLLYAAQIADIVWMAEAQFLLLGIGFLAIFITVFLMVRKRKNSVAGAALFLGMAPWKIPFLFLMTVTSLGAEGILAYLSFQRGLRLAAAGFVVGVLGLLAMGALASAEQSVAMQWVEESVNTLGQGGFMVGCILLYRDFKARGCALPASSS
jgi:hypothetical protein